MINYMKKRIFIILICILMNTITAFTSNKDRLELANLTVQYCNLLSNREFSKLINLLDSKFSVNGIINFENRRDILNFFKKVYGTSNQLIELDEISILNHQDIVKINSKLKEKLFHGINSLTNSDWITLIYKIKINGEINSSNIILIFKRKSNGWLIKGMYSKDLL